MTAPNLDIHQFLRILDDSELKGLIIRKRAERDQRKHNIDGCDLLNSMRSRRVGSRMWETNGQAFVVTCKDCDGLDFSVVLTVHSNESIEILRIWR